MLNKDQIIKQLNATTRAKISSIETVQTIASTNDYLLAKIKKNPVCMAIFSEEQTKGRGQRGKPWVSPKGGNIYLSFSWIFNKNLADLPPFSIVAALAVCQAIESCISPCTLGIKWPNDVFFERKKLAGILIESQVINHNKTALVIGIGINVHAQNAHQSIDQPWTSITQISPQPIEREQFATQLLQSLIETCEVYDQNGLSPFLEKLKQKDIFENIHHSLKALTNKD